MKIKARKSLIIPALLMAMMISTTLTGFADNGDKAIETKKVEEIQKSFDQDTSFVNKPKDFLLNTTNDTVIISGDGKANDKITISLYKRVADEYVLMGDKIELNLGALGVFTKEISLKDLEATAPKESSVSKETLVVLELRRNGNSAYDYRLIKFSDDKDVKESLRAIKLY